MKLDHSEFKEDARKTPMAGSYPRGPKTRHLLSHRWKTKGGSINVLTNFAAMLYIFFCATASAFEYQTIINTEDHSELARRLLLDASTDNPSSIRSHKGGSVVPKGSSAKAVGRDFSVQRQGAENLFSAEKTGPVTPVCTKKYSLTDLGTLGGSQSFAYAINNSGSIVGYSSITGDSTGHSFLYRKGRMTDLYPFNSQSVTTVGPTGINARGKIASGSIINNIYSPAIFDTNTHSITMLGSLGGVTSFGFNGVATSINNSGQAVGYSYIDDINRHAFLYSKGVMTDIGSFGGYSGANAINDKGMIVGFASDLVNGRAHAFLYADGVMTDIDPYLDFSRSESYARDINNRGQVVGEFLTEDQSATHAFLYNKGVFTDLGMTASPYTVALGINDKKQVAGITDVPYEDICFDLNHVAFPCIKYKQHAFVYEKGQITDLNTLITPQDGWELTWAFDINNQGKIVGYGLKQGKFRAFLLTPRGKRCT